MNLQIQGNAEPELIKVGAVALEDTGYGDIRSTPEIYNHAFRVRRTAQGNKVTVTSGTVSGLTPTIGGSPIDDNPAPQLDLDGFGDHVAVYLYGTAVLTDTETFGDLETIEILAERVSQVPPSTFENPVKRLATVRIVDGVIGTISQEVTTSFDLVRWYDYNVWLPGGAWAS